MKQSRFAGSWVMAGIVLASAFAPTGCSPSEKPPDAPVAIPTPVTPTPPTPPSGRPAGNQVKNIKNIGRPR